MVTYSFVTTEVHVLGSKGKFPRGVKDVNGGGDVGWGLITDSTLSLRKVITSSIAAFVRQSVKQSADATPRPEL